jgi:hypothetical protein
MANMVILKSMTQMVYRLLELMLGENACIISVIVPEGFTGLVDFVVMTRIQI